MNSTQNPVLRSMAGGGSMGPQGQGHGPRPLAGTGAGGGAAEASTHGFGEALKMRRVLLGYTQKQVAEECGVDQSVMVKLEQRAYPPRNRDLIARLAGIYLGTMEELLAGYIPAGFPGHLIAAFGASSGSTAERGTATEGGVSGAGGAGQVAERGESAESDAREAIRGLAYGVHISMSALRDLSAEELAEIARVALQVRRESAQAQSQSQSQSQSQGQMQPQEPGRSEQ